MQEVAALVVDHGSQTIKAGFAGDDAPRAVFPAVFGVPRNKGVMVGMGQKDYYVGDEAQSKRGILSLNYPIEFGLINDFNALEKIWHHTFFVEMRAAPEEHPILFSDFPMSPVSQKEKMTQIGFETFNTPAIAFEYKPVLSLYASGRTTGITSTLGHTSISTVPIYEGSAIRHASFMRSFGGKHLIDYTKKTMTDIGYRFTTTAELEMVRDMMENFSFVALDYEQELVSEKNVDRNYELPSGGVITMGKQRFLAPELLFNPLLASDDSLGIKPRQINDKDWNGLCNEHELLTSLRTLKKEKNNLFSRIPDELTSVIDKFSLLKKPVGQELSLQASIYQATQLVPAEMRRDLYGNIVLSGGASLFPGIVERLHNELVNLAPSATRIKVLAPPDRKYSSWIGGSILSSLSTFQGMWLSVEEYDEIGPDAAKYRFF